MALKLIIAPAAEPISVDEAKLHLRVDGTDDDLLIAALITAAREQAEHRTGRALVNQNWELALDDFPAGEIELPKVPASSIVSVKYLNAGGNEQTIAGANYGLDNYGLRHWVIPADGYSWPDTNGGANNVKVQFVAGYGDATAVPASIKNWMKLAIGTWYSSREGAGDVQTYALPRDFMDGLLDAYRVNVL